MKSYLLLIPLLVASPLINLGRGQDRTIDSSVQQVTVFRNGAQITRVATVSLTSGRNEITFEGLAPSLKTGTIQLSGGGNFMILSLTHRRDYLGEHPQKELLQKLTNRRDSLEQRIEDKQTTNSILERELNILLSNTSLKGNQQNLSADELEKAMNYFHRKLTDLKTRQLTINREITDLQNELQKIKNQINELDDDASRNRSVITAILRSETSGEARLTLTYQVPNAGWNPSYDIRVDDIEGPVNLSYKADIHQSTGIDWKNVNLEVSSAIPIQQGGLPQLQPWYIQFYEPRTAEMETGANAVLKTPAQGMAADKQRKKSQSVPVREIQHQTSFSYQIDLPYDVPSGGKPLTVEINNNDIPSNYRYYTVPKRRAQAYLTARISDWDQYNLLPGEANLFFENTYVGNSSIDPRTVGDTLAFSLGRDESIVVERSELEEFEEKNFFGNKIRETFAREISVRNSKDKPINIEVLDQVPVSQHEDINVSLEESSGANYDRKTGMLTWNLQLKSGETKKVRFVYEVEYPEGKKVGF